ncbi:MAG: response regulator [Bacteroidia bacterium]|nr:response regulator [Bacteroidia bacterium]
MVEIHKGRIWLESRENEGTTFYVTLPLAEETYSPKERMPKETPVQNTLLSPALFLPRPSVSAAVPSAGQKKTLMFVDDNPDILSYLQDFFQDNYFILTTSNGLEAIKMIHKSAPDLIVSDVMMPKINGWDLCQKLKSDEITYHIPVILLTAKTDDSSEKHGYTLGADAYLTKPFDMELLETRIRKLLESRLQLKNKYENGILPEFKNLEPAYSDEKFLKNLLEVLEKNLSDADLSIEAILKELGISRATLFRKIKAITNLSIADFIMNYRLSRAAELLKTQHVNVSEVAYEVGFKNPSHFATRFKKKFEQTPSEFMAQKQPNSAST